MKIVRGGDGSLTVQVRPGIFPDALLALTIPLPLWKLLAEGPYPASELPGLLVASLIAAAALSWIAEVSDFTFDPNRRQLRWSRKTFYSRQGGCVPLGEIRSVDVASRLTSGGDYYLHQVVLSLRGTSLPLTRYFATGRRSEVVARAIREFLAARGLPETVKKDECKRTAVGFRRDSAGGWTAQLDCGHSVPVRHEPPWVDLLTEEGRKNAVGMFAACPQCGVNPESRPASSSARRE